MPSGIVFLIGVGGGDRVYALSGRLFKLCGIAPLDDPGIVSVPFKMDLPPMGSYPTKMGSCRQLHGRGTAAKRQRHPCCCSSRIQMLVMSCSVCTQRKTVHQNIPTFAAVAAVADADAAAWIPVAAAWRRVYPSISGGESSRIPVHWQQYPVPKIGDSVAAVAAAVAAVVVASAAAKGCPLSSAAGRDNRSGVYTPQ